MSKTLLSLEELKDRAFQAIKRCEGCGEVSDVTIYEIREDAARSNWAIGSICVGPAPRTLRTALRYSLNMNCETISIC